MLKTVPIIIEGGTLIDPATGDTVEGGVLVLRDGKVEAVGTRQSTQKAVKDADGQATRINATGKFIIPGMVDAHVHANGLEDVRLILQSGATTVRSGSSTFYQDIALASLPKWNPGLSPRMHPAGLFVSPEQGDSILADPELAPLAALEDNIRDPKGSRLSNRCESAPRRNGHQDARQSARGPGRAGPVGAGLRPGAAIGHREGGPRSPGALPRL